MGKKRNINKELYPSKWKEFCEKYGEIEAVEYYDKFLRSFCEEKYILKYGEIEGKKKYKEKKQGIDRGMGLKSCIRRYGEEIGKEKHKQWKKDVRQDKESFIKRYGQKVGEEKFNQFRNKCIKTLESSSVPNNKQNTRLEYWLEKCNGDVEKAKKCLKKRQTYNLDRYIKKYGKEEGLKKYQEINKKKSNTLENFINRYGDIKGPEKYYQWIEKLKYAQTKDRYIKKYGKEEGLKKYQEIVRKKANHVYQDGQSIIGLEFCENINNAICDKFKKIYFGNNEYKFFIWDDNIKIAIVDFYIKDINLIIEFYGDYWHRNPKKYNDEISKKIREKDEKRIISITKKFGSEVIIVWEDEYRNNKQKVLNKIIKYLKEIKND